MVWGTIIASRMGTGVANDRVRGSGGPVPAFWAQGDSMLAGGTRCVVTGGAGFIGSHVAARLAAHGCRVLIVDNLSTGDESNLAGSEERRVGKECS